MYIQLQSPWLLTSLVCLQSCSSRVKSHHFCSDMLEPGVVVIYDWVLSVEGSDGLCYLSVITWTRCTTFMQRFIIFVVVVDGSDVKPYLVGLPIADNESQVRHCMGAELLRLDGQPPGDDEVQWSSLPRILHLFLWHKMMSTRACSR